MVGQVSSTARESERQSVTFTSPQMAFLKKEAKKLGVSVGELIRRIVDQFRGA
jgi:hypothetical protein